MLQPCKKVSGLVLLALLLLLVVGFENAAATSARDQLVPKEGLSCCCRCPAAENETPLRRSLWNDNAPAVPALPGLPASGFGCGQNDAAPHIHPLQPSARHTVRPMSPSLIGPPVDYCYNHDAQAPRAAPAGRSSSCRCYTIEDTRSCYWLTYPPCDARPVLRCATSGQCRDSFPGHRTSNLGDRTSQSVLQAGICSNTGGWLSSYHPNGNTRPMARDEQWKGPVLELIKSAAAQAGLSINLTDKPEWVLDRCQSASPFTQCAYATGQGHLDLCIGLFSITEETARMSSFITIGTHPMYLMVKNRPTSAMALDCLHGALESPRVAVLAALVLVLLMVVGYSCTGILIIILTGHGHPIHCSPHRRTAVSLALLIFLAIAAPLGLGVVLGQLRGVPQCGSLTNQFLYELDEFEFKSPAEALTRGARVCVMDESVATLRAAFADVMASATSRRPDLSMVTGVRGRSDVFSHMRNGSCDAGVAFKEDLQQQHSMQQSCNIGIVDSAPVLRIAVGFPVSDDNSPRMAALSRAIQRSVANGQWERRLQPKTPQSQCGSVTYSLSDPFNFSAVSLQSLVNFATALLSALYFYRNRAF